MASQMYVGNVRFFQLLQEQTSERENQKNQEPESSFIFQRSAHASASRADEGFEDVIHFIYLLLSDIHSKGASGF